MCGEKGYNWIAPSYFSFRLLPMEFGLHVGKTREPKLWKGNQLPQAREWKMQPSGWTRASRALHNSLFSQRAAGKRLRFNLGRYSPRIWTRAPARWCILFLFWCATLLGVLISLDIKFYSLMHFCVAFSLSPPHARRGRHRSERARFLCSLNSSIIYKCMQTATCYFVCRTENPVPSLQDTHTLSGISMQRLFFLSSRTARARRYIPLGSTKRGDHLASLLYDRYRLSTRISPQKNLKEASCVACCFSQMEK